MQNYEVENCKSVKAVRKLFRFSNYKSSVQETNSWTFKFKIPNQIWKSPLTRPWKKIILYLHTKMKINNEVSRNTKNGNFDIRFVTIIGKKF